MTHGYKGLPLPSASLCGSCRSARCHIRSFHSLPGATCLTRDETRQSRPPNSQCNQNRDQSHPGIRVKLCQNTAHPSSHHSSSARGSGPETRTSPTRYLEIFLDRSNPSPRRAAPRRRPRARLSPSPSVRLAVPRPSSLVPQPFKSIQPSFPPHIPSLQLSPRIRRSPTPTPHTQTHPNPPKPTHRTSPPSSSLPKLFSLFLSTPLVYHSHLFPFTDQSLLFSTCCSTPSLDHAPAHAAAPHIAHRPSPTRHQRQR